MGQPSSTSSVVPSWGQAVSTVAAMGNSNQGSSPASSSSVAPAAGGKGACQTIWLWGVAASSERGSVSADHCQRVAPSALRKARRYKCTNPGRSAGSRRNWVTGMYWLGNSKCRVWRSWPMTPDAVSLRASL